jgi:phosphatidylglycerophosphate synthase
MSPERAIGPAEERVKRWVKQFGRKAVAPVGRGLASVGITANQVTLFGLLVALTAAYGFWIGNRLLAFLSLLVSGVCDMLDGAVARAGTRSGTPFGAALDSTCDRYGEGLILGAIVARLAARGAPLWLIALGLLAGIGSYLVSYVRARSEGLGIPCEVGLLERPERLVFLLILSLWGDQGAMWILGALALLTHTTFVHRLVHVRRHGSI